MSTKVQVKTSINSAHINKAGKHTGKCHVIFIVTSYIYICGWAVSTVTFKCTIVTKVFVSALLGETLLTFAFLKGQFTAK